MDINLSGADIRSVCAEAGMFAIRARRKTVIEKDFLDAVTKVVKSYHKFSATPTYMVYNWSQQSGSGEISAVTGKQHYITDYRSYECSRYCFFTSLRNTRLFDPSLCKYRVREKPRAFYTVWAARIIFGSICLSLITDSKCLDTEWTSKSLPNEQQYS